MFATAEAPPLGYRWAILGVLSANMVTNTMLGVSLGLLLPAMLQDIAMTPVQQGWLSSSLRLGTATLAIPAAWWFARYNPRTIFIVATLAGSVLVLGQAAAAGFGMLLIARAGYGLISLAQQPARTLIIRQWFPDRDIALANGVSIFIIGVAEFGVAAGTPYLMAFLGGWRPTLTLMGAWAVAVALLWLVLGRERITPEYEKRLASLERPAMWSILRYRELWLVGAGVLGGPAAWWAFGTFWPGYMERTYGIPLTSLGFVFGLTSLGMAPAGLAFGYLASHYGVGRWVLMGCGVVMASFSLALLLVDSFPLLVAAGLLVGFSWGFVPIVTTIPYELPDISPREVAVAASFVTSMFALGGAVGPVVAGFLLEVTGSTFAALAMMSLCPLSISAIGIGMPQRRAALAAVPKEA